MFKKITYILIMLVLFSSCSIDTKTGLWENKKEPLLNKQLSTISFDENLSFEDYKENIILYGKKSKFPKLDDNK
tara:strand:+ start:1908 stop:2129 length:222 start_codon:yes stop_codon:yes gene_type:complete